MSHIQILYEGICYPVKVFTFSGGEAHVKVAEFEKTLRAKQYDINGNQLIVNTEKKATIIARMQNPGALIEILQVAHIVKRLLEEINPREPKTSLTLKVPYLPYARQDRVIEKDEPESLMVFLFALQYVFSRIETYDVHNIAACHQLAFHLQISEKSQLDCIKANTGLDGWIKDNRPVIVAPDKGAFYKAVEVAKYYDLPFISGHKKRDTTTGQVVSLEVPAADFVEGRNVLIVDDICDGGRTFTELATELDRWEPKTVALYVTHGIFSKGYQVFNGLIDRIYTTNTFIPKSYPMPGETPLFIHKLVEEV